MVDFTTPAGRIVWGNPVTGRPVTDDRTKQSKLDKNGQAMTQWAFGLAIPKNDCGGLMAALQQAASEIFPAGVPANFSWKIKDGDGVDPTGKPYAEREGWAGCFILAISTTAFQPQVVKNVNGAYSDWAEIKTGDYVRAAISLKSHQSQTPGIYVNPVMIEFLGYGDEIRNGPDANQVFGGQAVPLPPGASATPTAPAGNMPVAGAPTVPVPSAPPPVAPVAGAPVPPIASPGNPAPPPAHDFVQNAGQPAAPNGAPMPPGWNPGQ